MTLVLRADRVVRILRHAVQIKRLVLLLPQLLRLAGASAPSARVLTRSSVVLGSSLHGLVL